MTLDFDDSVFDELSASLDAAFPEILNVFLEETEFSLREIEGKVEEGKLEEIQDIAHKVKSSTKTFGAFSLANLLEQLESLDEKEIKKLSSIQAQLIQEYKLVKEHILSKPI